MQFLYPVLLLGLVAVIIPIIVHLFNFRKYRKLYFSNVQFLKELKQQTRKQSNLLHRLILLFRILIIVFIVLAFAQPFFSKTKVSTLSRHNAVSIYVDNSFSMEATGSNGSLLNEAKVKATEIVSAYSQDDHFQILTNDFEGKHQQFVSKDEFISMLNDIKVSPATRSLAEINSRQTDLLNRGEQYNPIVHIISDFQRSTILGSLPDTTMGNGFLIPLKSTVGNNIYIDSCWFSNPVLQVNEQVTLFARIKNVSNSRLEKIPVRLKIMDAQRSVASVDINAGSTIETSFTFSNIMPGAFHGSLEINDFPVTYDDIYYFAFKISPTIPVLCINNDVSDPYINSLYSVDSVIHLVNTTVRQIDFSNFNSQSLIILNRLSSYSSGLIQELAKFTENGGSIAIIPSLDSPVESVNQLLSRLNADMLTSLDKSQIKLSKINTRHPLYREVFEQETMKVDNLNLPTITQHYGISSTSGSTSETLLELSNGQSFLSIQRVGTGKVYLFTTALIDEATNFTRHAIFVPTMLNIAFQSERINPLMYYTEYSGPIAIASSDLRGDQVLKLRKIPGEYEFIPQERSANGQSSIFINNQVTESGIYQLMAAKAPIDLLAFNYNRLESNLAIASQEDLELVQDKTRYQIIETSNKPLNKILGEKGTNNNLWKWFIIAALLSLVIEVILLRVLGKQHKAV